MSKRATLRPRSKRKVKVNHPLTEQDLQAYLDDGYTPAGIAKECGVSLTVISGKMQKFGIKGRSKPGKVVKKRRKPVPLKKQKPRGRPSNRKPPTKRRHVKKEVETLKQDLNSVVTQVIQDNPKDADNIHSLLDFMGFHVEKSFVKNQLQKWKSSPRKGQNPDKDGESSKGKEKGTTKEADDTPQATTAETDDVIGTQSTDDGSPKLEAVGETSEVDDKKVTVTSQEDNLTEEVKEGDGTDGSDDKDETPKQEPVKKRGRPKRTCKIEPLEMKPAKRPKRVTRKTDKKDEDAATSNTGDNNDIEDGASDNIMNEGAENKKRGRKRGPKRKTETKEDPSGNGKGRPRMTLTKENLQLCVDSGLTNARIAEVFGAGLQSVKRYLRIHKMRKKDRVSRISDEELDKMVMEMCKAHPEWGQVHIQEELQRKGFYLRRAQVRNSVRRVDPVGIEVRRLKNLKMRWNRGSINKLDKILPADGINMTSTESFVSKPPRSGLNALNDEESVRILASVVASTKKTYVESMSQEILKLSKKSENKDELLDSNKEQPLDKNSNRKESQTESVVDALEAENEDKRVETGNKENIGTDSNEQPDSRTSFPQMSDEEDEDYRKRFYKMIMSYEKCRREPSPETNESVIDIPKEELEECVHLGFSTARIADKFSTSRANVIRHLHKYKLGKAKRFEDISDDTLDQIVTDVINEFSIKKGSDVYGYAKKKGYQIRRVDINKSLSRLFPKGLHRKSSSILQQSWDAASNSHPSTIVCVTTQDQGQVIEIENGGEAVVLECTTTQEEGQTVELGSGGEALAMECPTSQNQMQVVQTAHGGETVVVLNSEELAQLIHGDGNIVIEYEAGEQATEPGVSRQMGSEIGGIQVGQVTTTKHTPQKVYVVADGVDVMEQK
ncbi:hypothetical protein HOLleu_32795 [Holothuria leucospilota]|uniref:Uncharacterized protein n=1 Tax=Holothuria leucospilota TaxID=206669 RepID=A0A9Q1BJD0_HOLLE|nr:hypothetical protein HOLleu_32795 [Holothuria leucospilota]